MASNSLAQKIFNKSDFSQDESSNQQKKLKKPTVYDAVAGRVSAAGFIPKQKVIPSTRDTASSSTTPIAPESVLFRHKKAPTRYAEFDIYFANERALKNDLPDSDLLKELHCYVSEFYSHAIAGDGAGVWRSMDETALIGFGILLEEFTRGILGENGDLVFIEGAEVNSHHKTHLETTSQSTEQDRIQINTASKASEEKAPKRKRQRLNE